jgi:hypothetical protein
MCGKPPGKTCYYNKRRDIILVLNYIFARRFLTHDGITLNDFILWLLWYNNMVLFSYTIMCGKPPGKPCYYNGKRDIILVLNYIFTRRFLTHDSMTLNCIILWLRWSNNMIHFSVCSHV